MPLSRKRWDRTKKKEPLYRWSFVNMVQPEYEFRKNNERPIMTSNLSKNRFSPKFFFFFRRPFQLYNSVNGIRNRFPRITSQTPSSQPPCTPWHCFLSTLQHPKGQPQQRFSLICEAMFLLDITEKDISRLLDSVFDDYVVIT